MTRTTREHRKAAVRARQFVGHDNRHVSELARSFVVATRAREEMEEKIRAARAAGTPWSVIAGIFGVSTQSTWGQYRHLDRDTA